jgi:hypothetical protein
MPLKRTSPFEIRHVEGGCTWERPYKFMLAYSGVMAHNHVGGDSIEEVPIVGRRVALSDGCAG